MRRPLAPLALLLAACAPAASTPTVAVPTAPPAVLPDTPPPARPAEHRSAHVRGPLADKIAKALHEATAGGFEFELEASGRMVIHDLKEAVDEEMLLADVDRVDYEHNPRFPKGEHWIRIYVKSGAAERVRWRQRGGPWQLVTRPFLVMPFHDKNACDDVKALFSRLIAP